MEHFVTCCKQVHTTELTMLNMNVNMSLKLETFVFFSAKMENIHFG